MRDFPESMKKTAQQESFWKDAAGLLNVTHADQIGDGVFGTLQTAIDRILKDSVSKIPNADYVESAPLAVGRRSPTSTLRFNKFSVPGPLLGILEQQRHLAMEEKGAPLEIMLNCAVKSMIKGDDDDFVRVIETSKGTLSWTGNNTKIILCSGAIPNATMLLNSFDSCRDTVGKRLTGHYVPHISGRCPVKNVKGWSRGKTLNMAAAYLAGKDPKTGLQYHVSVTALNSPNPKDDAEDAARECPDYAAAATLDQLTGSEDYVVFGMNPYRFLCFFLCSFAIQGRRLTSGTALFFCFSLNSLLSSWRIQREERTELRGSQQGHRPDLQRHAAVHPVQG
jgi:hypothetical protein